MPRGMCPGRPSRITVGIFSTVIPSRGSSRSSRESSSRMPTGIPRGMPPSIPQSWRQESSQKFTGIPPNIIKEIPPGTPTGM